MWQANVTINNNSGYTITVEGVGPGSGDIADGSSTSWTCTQLYSAKSLLFWNQVNEVYMAGNICFGPELIDGVIQSLGPGVYVDRGNLPELDQSIKLVGNANGKSWTQSQNGGETILTWNEFDQGGSVTLTFNKK